MGLKSTGFFFILLALLEPLPGSLRKKNLKIALLCGIYKKYAHCAIFRQREPSPECNANETRH